jgi:uncharacterized protein YukE
VTENFRIDADGVSSATGKLRDAGDALGSAFDTLKQVLDEHDGCWGNDDTGKSFAEGYKPAADKARTGADSAVQGISSIADSVDHSAEEFENTDADNAAAMDQAYEPQQ